MTRDPDSAATADAAVVLKKLLTERGHATTAKEAEWLAFSTVCEWTARRAFHWAQRRGSPKVGSPDAMTLGFAEAALPLIAAKASALPFGEPIGKWSKVDAARLFAFAHEVIEAVRIRTQEDPTTEEVPA